MNKKVTIFAAVLIIIGIIGTILSSIASVPFVTNYIKELKKDANEEVNIYENKVDISKLEIDTKHVNVEIKKSNSDKLKIVQVGKTNNKTFTIDNKENYFSIKENDENYNFNVNIQGFRDAIIEMMNFGPNKIIVYVPNGVDIKAKTLGGSLIIEDKNIILDNVTFDTVYGRIFLPNEIKNMKNLKISAKDSITLTVGEVLGIENVNISSDYYVNIKSESKDIFTDNIDKYVPNKINVFGDTVIDVDIDSYIPIAKNLNIVNKLGSVNIDLPIDNYNLKFDLSSENAIYYLDGDNSSDVKTFKGSFNNSNDNKSEYKISIKAKNINIKR